MYGSHEMRHIGFRRLTVVNGTPESGRHNMEGMQLGELLLEDLLVAEDFEHVDS